MKKIFISMMLAGALVAGNTAMAQTKTDGSTGATAQKECCQTGKDGKKWDKKGDKKDKKGQRPRFNPFDGVQLTPDQQQKLQVLREGLGPVVLTPAQQAAIPENKDLTKEQKKQLKEERKAKKLEAKKKYLNGVKEILTPDQYVVFLENVYLYHPIDKGQAFGKNKGPKDMKDKKDKKDHKGKGKKGEKKDETKQQ